ncbi:MAG: response regulator [Deltaproteobacteria bacterium]|nr:response regulator [Deltaproteobacteria bacterium]
MSSRISVLVVDDHQDSRVRLVEALLQHGFEVDEAENGTKAASKIKREAFDVVITNISMPHGNGIELLNKVKKLNAQIRVFLMSDYPDLYAEYQGFELADAVFRKPVDLVEVVRAVQKGSGPVVVSSLVA